MEFIPGETLQQRLDRTGPLDPAETVRLGRQIAEGLAAAHATGLIHRDIKPGNVLIENGPYERVKITDFGLARAADDASVTQSGVLAGTPMYMAPEQARGESLDHRADLFSLGSVLYVMVTGRPPFRAPSTYAVLKRVADDHPRPIKEVIPEVPTWLCDIISTLHAKNADDRFQNAREVADMLTDCEKQLNASGKVKIKVRRSTRPNVIPLTPVSQPAPKRASRWKWAAAIFLASALVTYGVFSLIQPGAQSAADGSENNNPGIDPTLVVAEDTKVHATDYDWIEVIPLIDPKLDKWDLPSTGKNEWRVENGELAGGYADAKPHKLLFPLDSDWAAFECEFEFTRRSGESGFNLCIPAKTGDCPVVFDYSGNGSVTLGKRGKAAAFAGKHQIQNGRRTAARVAILKVAETDQVEVLMDGISLGKWTGDRNRIANVLNESYPTDRRLSLWIQAGGSEYVFHRIRVRMLEGGTAEPLRPAKNTIPATFTNSLGMEFVIVPKGKSWLGGGEGRPGNKEVEIQSDFYLGKYEVTQEEWEKVMGQNPSHFSRNGKGSLAVKDIPDAELNRFPAENVSWDQCQEFVQKLNRREQDPNWVYRLPTWMEWDYACRGGPMLDKAESAFMYYGTTPANTLSMEQANFGKEKGLNRTCKAGAYAPNRLGLFDMHGNVFEWCDDTFRGTAERTHIGGSWHADAATSCRASGVVAGNPAASTNYLGLRLARFRIGVDKLQAKPQPVAVDPFTDADVQHFAALPALEQAAEVRKELMKLNAAFDGIINPTIEDGAVTGLIFSTAQVTDISPVRALPHLKSLQIRGLNDNGLIKGRLQDLSPLKGMALTSLDIWDNPVWDLTPLRGMPLETLSLWNWAGSDLRPLKGMPLKQLNCGGQLQKLDLSQLAGMPLEFLCINITQVSDLTPLAKLPLTQLLCSNTLVTDLSPLRGMPLRQLHIRNCKVPDLTPIIGMPLGDLEIMGTPATDLSPLKDLPLKRLKCDFQGARDAKILSAIKSLETINSKPATEFLAEH
jgi:formylglycine-generating enzyme required for sulfatase activity